MPIHSFASQLRTVDLDRALTFYTECLGFTVDFRYEDFYAGISLGGAHLHLKHVDSSCPSIAFVEEGGHLHLWFAVSGLDDILAGLAARGVHPVCPPMEKPWGMREAVIQDPDGHTLYLGEPLPPCQDGLPEKSSVSESATD